VAEWQTHGSQKPARATSCGFDSHLRHQPPQWYNAIVGAWLSLVERSVRDAEAGGSNPLAPTKTLNHLHAFSLLLLLFHSGFSHGGICILPLVSRLRYGLYLLLPDPPLRHVQALLANGRGEMSVPRDQVCSAVPKQRRNRPGSLTIHRKSCIRASPPSTPNIYLPIEVIGVQCVSGFSLGNTQTDVLPGMRV
jgi:hypothetical protein